MSSSSSRDVRFCCTNAPKCHKHGPRCQRGNMWIYYLKTNGQQGKTRAQLQAGYQAFKAKRRYNSSKFKCRRIKDVNMCRGKFRLIDDDGNAKHIWKQRYANSIPFNGATSPWSLIEVIAKQLSYKYNAVFPSKTAFRKNAITARHMRSIAALIDKHYFDKTMFKYFAKVGKQLRFRVVGRKPGENDDDVSMYVSTNEALPPVDVVFCRNGLKWTSATGVFRDDGRTTPNLLSALIWTMQHELVHALLSASNWAVEPRRNVNHGHNQVFTRLNNVWFNAKSERMLRQQEVREGLYQYDPQNKLVTVTCGC